jgi:hypothetical protein
MTVIRAELAHEFMFGDDVVLLAMDTSGVSIFLAAMTEAESQGSSRLRIDQMDHEFRIESGAADVDLDNDRVVWRLDHAKALEIIELLAAMGDHTGAGHHYVDISAPAQTLVLSRNEYV